MGELISYQRLWEARREKRARESIAQANANGGLFGISAADYPLWKAAKVEAPPLTSQRLEQMAADMDARAAWQAKQPLDHVWPWRTW